MYADTSHSLLRLPVPLWLPTTTRPPDSNSYQRDSERLNQRVLMQAQPTQAHHMQPLVQCEITDDDIVSSLSHSAAA